MDIHVSSNPFERDMVDGEDDRNKALLGKKTEEMILGGISNLDFVRDYCKNREESRTV